MAPSWLMRLLGRSSRPASTEPNRCAHCGYEVPGVGVQPSSCPRCGQVLRISA